jgi:hypothetical protein
MPVSSDTRPVWSIASFTRRQVLLASQLTRAEARAYDQFVATAPSGHYSQTRAWARVVAAERSVEPLFFLVRYGDEVIGAGLVLRPVLGGVPLPVARIEHGPVTAAPEDLPEVLTALRQSCLGKGILRLAVAPNWTDPHRLVAEAALSNAGFAPRSRADGRLARAKRLDLAMLNEKKSWCASNLIEIRQAIGAAARAGVSVRPGQPEDLVALSDLTGWSLPATAALGGYFFRPGAAMFVSTFRDSLISAVFANIHNGLATSIRAFTSSRALPFSSSVLAVTEAMQWARRMGARAFEEQEGSSPGFAGYCRTEVLLVGEHVRWW